MEDDYDWIKASESRLPSKVAKTRKIDKEVSDALGKPVMANDPRLIRLVVKWKKKTGSSADFEKPDNFMHTPGFLAELKKEFDE